VLTRPAPAPDLTLSYGPLPEQVVDVRLPAGTGRAPLVVVVHGGFWMAEWDRTHAGPQSAGLAAAGYVVATAEYRRVGQPGGGWPGIFDDAALLADTVPARVRDAVGDRVDATAPVLVGHSAGGHLAAWAAARHRLPAGSRWHRSMPLDASVVSLAGVLDLVEAERRGLGDGAARLLLDGSPHGQPERYAVASPIALLPAGARAVLVHGTADVQVPVEISRAYARRAAETGDQVSLRELDGVGHFELIDPLSPAWPTVLAAVASLLR
jgi:acetyl esterase/lipase